MREHVRDLLQAARLAANPDAPPHSWTTRQPSPGLPRLDPAGDQLGARIVRLARLAAAAHLMQATTLRAQPQLTDAASMEVMP